MHNEQSERPELLEFFATCLNGFEAALAAELKHLRVRRVRPLGGGVAFFGAPVDAERVCLWSRVASRVLCVLDRVNAGDADLLYAGVYRIPWENVVAYGASVSVAAHGTNEQLRNTKFTALKVKDALCDRMRDRCGCRPDTGVQGDLSIDVRVRGARATISLDITGESLHKRIYMDPSDGRDASLACARAAGLLVEAGAYELLGRGWGLLDPACDAGFVVCEAAGIAADLAPALLRSDFNFFSWALHDEQVWSDELARADERFEVGLARLLADSKADGASGMPNPDGVRFVGVASSSVAVSKARAHLRNAGLRAVASVEADTCEGVTAVAARVARVIGDSSRVEGDRPALMVVYAEPSEMGEARAIAEANAFTAAAKAAPAGSLFASLSAEGFGAQFGSVSKQSSVIGEGRRFEERLEIYDNPPVALFTVSVPDAHGGAEHFVEVHDETAGQFASRLRKVARERRKWARRENVGCYRVYDADMPEYSVAIDIYEGAGRASGNTYVHIAEYAPPSSVDPVRARRRFEDALALTPIVLGVRADHVFSKMRRRAKGGSQYSEERRYPYVTQVSEDNYLMEVDLNGYLDTGLFLDHRVTREMVGELASGTRFLNLFAYTGAATVHAAGGGAQSTVTVDLSQTYLDWAQRNMEANGFTGRQHRFVRADVTRWISDARRRRLRFDLIFVDPPTFSNSKSMGSRTWEVQRDHVELLIGVSRLLAPAGKAVFSCNLRSFKPDLESLEKAGVVLEDITDRTIPHDFERNRKIHKCYILTRK